MAFSWMTNFLIPLFEITFFLGLVSWIGFYVGRGFFRNWQQRWKWFFKFSIMRKPYPEKAMRWSFDAIEKNLGYYDAKKMLFVNNGENMDQVYETLYIYDKLQIELSKNNKNKSKEEMQDAQKLQRGHNEIKSTEFPSLK
jgi:hypothetical protein